MEHIPLSWTLGLSALLFSVGVAGVVLAAGQSSRMGSNKLLADVTGQPMIRRTVAAMRQAADVTVVVTGGGATGPGTGSSPSWTGDSTST